jgi:GlpG protein
MLAALIVAIELATVVAELRNENSDQREVFSRYFGMSPALWAAAPAPANDDDFFSPRPWAPFSSTLLHVNLIHMGFNLYWLLAFGGYLELRYGSARLLLLILLLAVTSNMPQFLISNYHIFELARWPILGWLQPILPEPEVLHWSAGVGFSGVGYGFFGFLFVARKKYHEFAFVCNDSIVRLFVIWFFLCILFSSANLYPIANTAHAAGALFGFLFAKSLYEEDRRRRLAWRFASGGLTLLMLLSMVIPPPGIPDLPWKF